MYEAFYGFREKPFNLTPDPKYLYLSTRHQEAFAHLEFGRRERGGFILVTGEVGTGKTTLARYFLSRLGGDTATAFVLYPALTGAELLRGILEDLHVPVTGTSLKDHVDALHRFLLQSRAENRNVVLVIDEAQDLSPEVLEQVRLISNLETDTEKLITIILMGQSELQQMLARHDLRQLAQRITARYHLDPLDRRDTEEYIRHRLEVAGGGGKVSFTSAALNAVRSLSTGVPRLVNLICDRALLAGYVRGSRVIDAEMVKAAAREVLGRPARMRRQLPLAAGLLAVAALGLVAAVGVHRTASADRPATSAAPAAPVPAADSVTSPVSHTPPAAAPLDPVLLALDHDASWDAALGRVQGLWAGDAPQRASLRTTLDQLRRLDMPAVLEMFHPARRDTCFVALLRLEGDNAVVGTASGVMTVAAADLDRRWTRMAQVPWRDFDAVAAGDPDRSAQWARNVLGRLGYGDVDLTAAVARFQRDSELLADGVMGARTLMALYSRGGYPCPRLGASPAPARTAGGPS